MATAFQAIPAAAAELAGAQARQLQADHEAVRLVRTENVREGMELARDVPARALGCLPLLRQGVALTESMGRRLYQLHVRAVWVEDGMGEGIDPAMPLPEHVRRSAEEASNACLEAARASANSQRRVAVDDIERIENAVGQIVGALADCPEAACALDDLASADSYTHTHSVRVTTLGLLLATRIIRLDGWSDWHGRQRYDRVNERLVALGTGLLIHDIGKISIPAELLNKPGKLTPEEYELIKTHPEAGASLLSPERVSPLTIAVVRDHHERWDGAGYPAGKAGDDLHQFARIASVADTYDAATADRPYRPALPPHVGVSIITEGAGTQFDPAVVEHFKRVVMPYPVGYTLQLKNGAEAVVAAVDPDRPNWPVLRYRDASGALMQSPIQVVNGRALSEPGEYGVPVTAVPTGGSVVEGAAAAAA
jgi:HD-GYP domain-containing protein (c-di-GMP phosphodiesterase class II)